MPRLSGLLVLFFLYWPMNFFKKKTTYKSLGKDAKARWPPGALFSLLANNFFLKKRLPVNPWARMPRLRLAGLLVLLF